MKLVKVNWSPTHRQLWQFGLLCVFALPLVGWFAGATVPQLGLLGVVGLIIACLAGIWPAAIRPLFVGLMIFTAPIGMLVAELALLTIYLLIFVPIGLAFRIVRRDALQLKINRDAETYWQDKSPPQGASSYYRKF